MVWISGPDAYITDDAGRRRLEGSYTDGSQRAVDRLIGELETTGLVDDDIALGAWYAATEAVDDAETPPGRHPPRPSTPHE